MIYATGGIKGGIGKTTIATNLAVWLSRRFTDSKVLLVDADDQESSKDFYTERKNNSAIKNEIAFKELRGEQILKEINNLADQYDYIVIDTGGRDTISQRAALMVSDAFLIPFEPTSLVYFTIGKVEAVLKDINSKRETPIPAIAFLNRAKAVGKDNIAAGNAIKQHKAFTYIDNPVINRTSLANAAGQGLAVFELIPQDKKASEEIHNLFTAILRHLQPVESAKIVMA